MAAQVEVQPGEVGRTGVGGRLHLSPLVDSSNKSLVEGPSGPQGSLIIPPEPSKPVPGPKPRLTPKPFSVDRNPTVRPILAPKPRTKPRPELNRPTSYKPDPPVVPKPEQPGVTGKQRPVSTNPGRPAPTSFKPSPKLSTGQTSKPVAQPFKPAPPLTPGDPSKPAPSQPAGSHHADTSGSSYSRGYKKPQSAEWSGSTKQDMERVKTTSSARPGGTSMTRAKSMGFLNQMEQEEEERKLEVASEVEVALRPHPRSSRPRPVSAIFLPSTTETEVPGPASQWSVRRPLSADLTSRFESIGLSLHRRPTNTDSKENTPEEGVPLRRREKGSEGAGGAAQGLEGKPKPSISRRGSDKVKEEGDEEKEEVRSSGGSIKRRISLLLDSSSSSPGGRAIDQAPEPRSPVQPIPEAEAPLGVKQRIKQLTEDTPPAQTPAPKPSLRPRPLPLDLTKRFTSDLSSPSLSEGTDRLESDIDPQRRGEDSASFRDQGKGEEESRGPPEPASDPTSDPAPGRLMEGGAQESSLSGGIQTVRAALFENVVERHSVLVLDEDQGRGQALPRRSLSLRRQEEEEGSLVTATYRQPASPSSPLRVEHSFDTVPAVGGSRVVSESVPSAQLEDKALTLRRRSDRPLARAELAEYQPPQGQEEVFTPASGAGGEQQPRFLRVGALHKWNSTDLEKEAEEERRRRAKLERQAEKGGEPEVEREMQREVERQTDVDRERRREKEREEVASPKRLKMLEANEQPAKPRATYFALTGQAQEVVSQGEESAERGDLEVPFDDFSVKTGQWGSQGKVMPLRRTIPLDDSLGKSLQSKVQDEERSARSPTQERQRGTAWGKHGGMEDMEIEKQRQMDLEKQRALDREAQRQVEFAQKLEREKQIELERDRQKELERQRQREMERDRQRALERKQELEKERQQELERERQRELERERQQELERERQRELQRERQQELEKERQQELERERQRELERERQRELERERQRELERERQRELERERQRELERERQRELERERQRELERDRQRELERERQRELERERQRELERQKEMERERQQLAMQRELERAKEQERRQLQEYEKQKQAERERQQLLEVEKQRLREKMEREEAEKMRQLAIQQEADRQRELEREREQQEREKERLRQLEVERQRQRDLERQRQLDLERQELDKQAARQRESERERRLAEELERRKEAAAQRQEVLNMETQRLLEKMERDQAENVRRVAAQQEVERQRMKDKQKREEQERAADSSPLRPKVLDIDSVTRDDQFSTNVSYSSDPSSRWRKPSPKSEEPDYRPGILDIDSFRPQAQVVPEGVVGRPSPVWTSSQQDPWELRQGEVVESLLAGPEAPRKPANKPSLEQLLLRQEERASASCLVPERCRTAMPGEPQLSTLNPMKDTSLSGPPAQRGLDPWSSLEAGPHGLGGMEARSQRRSQGSQELNRMRSRSVSRRSTPASSTLEGSLFRVRSRSAHRERGGQGWESQKQGAGSDEEGKDTDTLVHDTDSQYGTWETGLRTDDSLTPATPTSEGNLSPSPGKPTPPHTPGEQAPPSDLDTLDGPSLLQPEPLPFPETSTILLDSSALRARAQLSKKRAPRSRPSRAPRQSAGLAGLAEGQAEPAVDWRYRDSTEEKVEPQQDESDSEEQARAADPRPAASQPQRVPIFPGMDPFALKAQLKKRGDSDSQSDGLASSPSQLSRSPKSPFLPRASRVLPPAGGKENGEEASPQWLRELKSKKRLSQYENDS